MPLGDQIRELDEHVAAAVRRAVDDLREEVRRRLDEATTDLQQRLGEVAPELPQSFVSEEHLRRIAEDAAAPSSEALQEARSAGRTEGLAALRDTLAALDRARSQTEILGALLAGAAGHAGRAAVLLVRDGRLSGWDARGFETSGEGVRGIALDAVEGPWAAAAAGEGPRSLSGNACAPLVSQLDSALPRDGVAIPLVLRDRVAAVVYADRPSEGDPLEVEALQVLTYAAALALETLAVRERPATATLEAVAGAGAPGESPPVPPVTEEPAEPDAGETAGASEADAAPGAPPPEPEPAAPPPAPPPAPAEAAGAYLEDEAPGAAQVEPEAEEAPAEEAAEPSPEPEEEIDLADLELGEAEPTVQEEAPTPPHGDELLGDAGREDLLQPAAEPTAAEPTEEEAPPAAPAEEETLDPSALDETAFEEAPPLEEDAAAPETPAEPADEPEAAPPSEPTEPAGQPSGGIPWQTGGTEPPADTAGQAEERPEGGAVPPSAPGSEAEAMGAAGAGGEVEPPADVEGPGWAFSATRQEVPEDEAAHEEARRLARLLVSEIQLYNQEAVDEGRRNRDVYERLKDDIDRSRELYEERVDSGVREATDYFYQELVRQLGGGDAKALGI